MNVFQNLKSKLPKSELMYSKSTSLFFIFIIASIPLITPLTTQPMPWVVSTVEAQPFTQQQYQQNSLNNVVYQDHLTPGVERFTLVGPASNGGGTNNGINPNDGPVNLINPETTTPSYNPSSSSSSLSILPPGSSNTFSLKIGNQIIPVSYTIEGGQLTNLTILPSNSTLLLDLDSVGNSFGGKLTINLPRSVIDAINSTSNGDIPFLVFDDGTPITQSVLEQGKNQQI